MRHLVLIAALVFSFVLTAHWPASAAPVGRVTLAGHLAPRAIEGLTLVGRLSSARTLSLDLVLPLRNQTALEDLLRRQADPTDALYGKYLTPSEFTDRFGPAVADVTAVASFAKAQSLTIQEISANRTTISVTGPVNAVETAFGVKMHSYTNQNGDALYAPDTEPTIPTMLSGKLLAVVGLTHVGMPRAFSHRVHPRPSSLKALPPDARPLGLLNASGVVGLSPTDIHTIYNLTNVSSKGSGQTLALYELDTYTPSDISEYKSHYGISNVTLQNVGVNGFNTNSTPGGAAAEVTLDIEMYLALAPSASKIIVYETDGGSTNADFETANVNIFNKFASDDTASVLSVSYGISELDVTQAEAQAVNQALMQPQAQGQTVCVAAGDAGAYTDQSNYPNDNPNTSEPGSQPLATSVGGTDLTDSDNSPYTYVSETSWSDPFDSSRGNDGTGGGGGISQYWTIPSYQTGSFSTSVNPQGSTTMRNVPDVSLYGDYDDGTGYDVYFQGSWGGYNGTSAASPLWAAFLADVDEARIAAGHAKLGLANTAIYSIAKSSKYASDFHDINDGSDNLYYNAVNGYDNSTGWGSFNGINLFNDLVSYGTAGVDVKSLSFSPDSSHPGDVITGTVTLTGNAPSGGAAVTIAQNGSSLGTVTVAAGSSSAMFTLTLGTATGTITFSATYNGSTASATVTVTAAAPTITSFSPTSGPVNTDVLVNGTGMTSVSAVKFNGVAASTFAANSDTQVEVIVPTGATTGKITVTTSGGSVTSSGTFTVTTTSGAPTVTSFTPTSGPVGTVVTVTGTNLNGVTAVRFHNANATTFSADSGGTQLTVTVPTGAATGTFTVTTSAGSVKTTGTFTVTTAPAPPTVTSFTPTSGPVGTVVTVTGTNLNGVTAVRFHNANAGTFSANSGGTQLTVTVPSGAGTGTFTVTTPGGSVKTTGTFTVTTAPAPPTVTSFTPTSGPVGTVVTVTGTNLNGVTAVRFHNANATTFSANSGGTQLTVTVPSGAGTGTFTVTTPGGSVKTTGTFTVTTGSAPTITSFSPTSGQVGATVVITGTGFSTTTGVTFNGTTASGSIDSDTQLTATVPTGATTGKITVTTSTGTVTSSGTFTVVSSSPPTISLFTPTSGPAGTSVTITGMNFTGASSVKFNGTAAASFTVTSATQVTATVPSGATSGTITVTTSAGTATSSSNYTVTF